MTARITEIRTALTELRADNERNARRIAWAFILPALSVILLSLTFLSPELLQMFGVDESMDEPHVVGIGAVVMAAMYLPWQFIGWQIGGVFLDRTQTEKCLRRREEEQRLYRMRVLEGSGLAEEFIEDRLGNGRLSAELSSRTGLAVSGKSSVVREQLRSLLAACGAAPKRESGGRIRHPLDFLLPLLFSGYVIHESFSIGPVSGVIALTVFILLAASVLLGRRTDWRLGLEYFGKYLDNAMDYYGLQGKVAVPASQLAAAPAEVRGTRLSRRVEAVCTELRIALDEREVDTLQAIRVMPVAGSMLAVIVPLVLSDLSASWIPGVLLAVSGLVLMMLSIHSIVGFDDELKRWRMEYRAGIEGKGLMEELLIGTLPTAELLEHCPSFLQFCLYLPTTTVELKEELQRNAWLAMWNLDWFLRGTGSSLRRDVLLLAAAAAPVIGSLIIMLSGSVPYSSLSPFPGLLFTPLLGVLTIAAYRSLLRQRAAALAMLDVLEERLLPAGAVERLHEEQD
ncbi:MAG: hypothetical protein R3F46_15900 [bacterium]